MAELKEGFTREPQGLESPPLTPDERKFLSDFLDQLEKEDPAASAALLESDPQWIEHWATSGNLRARIRAALAGESQSRPLPGHERGAHRIFPSTSRDVAGTERARPDSVFQERAGILTSVTRKVSPEKAVELYRKIAPVFVYQILNRLNESSNLGVVQRIVEHLCGEETQRRLRACEHVRDGILDEFRSVLGPSESEHKISREELQDLLAETGALNELMAMENCIKLTAAKAG